MTEGRASTKQYHVGGKWKPLTGELKALGDVTCDTWHRGTDSHQKVPVISPMMSIHMRGTPLAWQRAAIAVKRAAGSAQMQVAFKRPASSIVQQ
jgi:hypothetical protein